MMLVLDGLTRYYGSFLALDHLSLTIHDLSLIHISEPTRPY